MNNYNNIPNSKRVAAVKKTLKKKIMDMQQTYPLMPLFVHLINKIDESGINNKLNSFKRRYKGFGVPQEYYNAFNNAVNSALRNENEDNNNNNNNNNGVLDVPYEYVKPTIGGPRSQLSTLLPPTYPASAGAGGYRTTFRRSIGRPVGRSIGGKRKTYRKRRQHK